jgi:DNA-binding NtrC family response regulator
MHYDEIEVSRRAATPASEGSYRTGEEFEHFLRHTERLQQGGGSPSSLRAWLELAEAWRITQALRDCKGNRSAAARHLGIGRRTLYAKMDKLGITPTWGF